MTWEDRRFVLLEDGTVWTWQRGEGIFTLREIYAAYGLVIGFAAAVLAILVRLTTRWSRPA